jgi:hypothetical protein
MVNLSERLKNASVLAGRNQLRVSCVTPTLSGNGDFIISVKTNLKLGCHGPRNILFLQRFRIF